MAALETFSDYLRKAREKSGLTQAALAGRCRLTGSYISLLESGKKPAPSDGVVKRLAAALSLAADEALQIAHLDRAPEDLRRALDRLRTQAAREREMRERTAEALFPFSLWNLVPGPSPAARAPPSGRTPTWTSSRPSITSSRWPATPPTSPPSRRRPASSSTGSRPTGGGGSSTPSPGSSRARPPREGPAS